MKLLFIGSTELLLIGGIALLMFGGKKFPEMMRGLGQGVKEFKKAMQSPEDEKENDLSKEVESKSINSNSDNKVYSEKVNEKDSTKDSQ